MVRMGALMKMPMGTTPATGMKIPLPGEWDVFLPECIKRSAIVGKKIRFVLYLPWISKDAELPVDFVSLCRVICKIKMNTAPVDSCRKCTRSPSSYFIQDLSCLCNLATDGTPVWLKRVKVKTMIGSQLSCLHFYSSLLDEEHENCWPTFFGIEVRTMFLCDHQCDQNNRNVWELH
jgi:hypothetical protein